MAARSKYSPSRRAFGISALALLAGGFVLAHCGGRSALRADESAGPFSAPDASTGTDADVDPDADAAPPPPCHLQQAGDPIELISFPDRHAQAPSMVVLRSGSPGQPAQVALQVMASGGSNPAHPDNQVALIRVGPAWPDDTAIEKGPTLVGIESHGWAEMARAPDATDELALAWYADPGMVGRTAFRTFDVEAWVAGPLVDLSFSGSSAIGLVGGMGIGPAGGGYGGAGYGILWRSWLDPPQGSEEMVPLVTVLDPDGTILLGPHRAAPPDQYPGRNPRITWTGTHYVLATSFRDCLVADPLCVPASVVITRVRPPSSDGPDDSGVDFVASIPVLESGTVPWRAWLATHEGHSYVTWGEGGAGEPEDVHTMRIAALNDTGSPSGVERVIATDARPLSIGTVSAGPLGPVVTWPQDGEEDLSEDALGRSVLIVHPLGLKLEPLDAIRVPITRYDSYGWPHTVTLLHPRGVLVTWTARSFGSGHSSVFVTRLDCMQDPPVDAGGQ